MTIIIAIIFPVLAELLIYSNTSGPYLSPETDAIIESVLNGELPEVINGETGVAQSSGLNIWYESNPPDATQGGQFCLLWQTGLML